MQILEGNIKVTGTVAFSSQDPWIMNGTARENILFGKPLEKERYRHFCHAFACVSECGWVGGFCFFIHIHVCVHVL